MNGMARCAFVIAQAACANARLTAMAAENAIRLAQGTPAKYTEADFDAVPDQYLIGHNAVIDYLRDT